NGCRRLCRCAWYGGARWSFWRGPSNRACVRGRSTPGRVRPRYHLVCPVGPLRSGCDGPTRPVLLSARGTPFFRKLPGDGRINASAQCSQFTGGRVTLNLPAGSAYTTEPVHRRARHTGGNVIQLGAPTAWLSHREQVVLGVLVPAQFHHSGGVGGLD